MENFGFIQIIFGPMFSGKSTELLRKLRRFQIAKKKCLIVKYAYDNRYTEEELISTHDKQMKKAYKCTKLIQLESIYEQYDVIGIDEGQFFTDVVQMCQKMANNGKSVIVAGLDGTYQRKPFGNILQLLPIAQRVTKLTAICIECGKDAHFTKRIIEDKKIQLIGGEQIYRPVCRICYLKTSNDKKQESQKKLKLE